jgi:hypothetical protein
MQPTPGPIGSSPQPVPEEKSGQPSRPALKYVDPVTPSGKDGNVFALKFKVSELGKPVARPSSAS